MLLFDNNKEYTQTKLCDVAPGLSGEPNPTILLNGQQ